MIAAPKICFGLRCFISKLQHLSCQI